MPSICPQSAPLVCPQQAVAVGVSAAVGALLLLAGAGAAWFWFSPAARHRRLHRQRDGGGAMPQNTGSEVSDDLVGWGARKPRPSNSTMLGGSATDTLNSKTSSNGTPSLQPQPPAHGALQQHGDSVKSPASAAGCTHSKRMVHLHYTGSLKVCAWDCVAGRCAQLRPSLTEFAGGLPTS